MVTTSTVLAALALASGGVCVPRPFVNWATPVNPTYSSQSDEQAARALAVGRFPDHRELLQPTLDSSLASYQISSAGLKGNYTFASSDVLGALSSRWIHEFMRMYPNVTMQIPGPFAGSLGALELIKGNLQGVFVSRELKPSDITSFRDAFGYDPTSVPTTGGSYRQFGFLDAMTFVVHKDNPIEQFSLTELDSILSTTLARGGKPIRTWGDLGVTGSLANEQINIYGIKPWNGFEEFIRQRVLSYGGVRGEWRSGAKTNISDKDPHVTWDATVFNMTQHVSNDPAGLAYTGMAYIDRPVKVVGLVNDKENSTGPIAPTYENIALGVWPLSRVTYFNTNTNPSKGMDSVLKELTKYILSKEGQQIALEEGVFLPFRKQQQESSLAMLN